MLVDLAKGLVLYYPFSNATVNGTRVANLATGSPVFNAILYDGSTVHNNQLLLSSSGSQFLSIGPSVDIGADGLTFATWFRSDNSGSFARIFDFGNGQESDNILMALNDATNELVVTAFLGNQQSAFAPSTEQVNNNVWFHAVWILYPTGNWVVYLDGQVVIQVTASYPNVLARSSNYLGKSNWNSDGHFNGAIRDFRMYNRTLSADEVSLLYNTSQVEH